LSGLAWAADLDKPATHSGKGLTMNLTTWAVGLDMGVTPLNGIFQLPQPDYCCHDVLRQIMPEAIGNRHYDGFQQEYLLDL
jgi:hypothetical protein